MKRILSAYACLIVSISMWAQAPEIFKPYQQTQLRVPSVPLVVNDPNFSIWSPFDKLTDGTTRHWTDDEKPLEGLLRVDGKTYRWMGTESRVPTSDWYDTKTGRMVGFKARSVIGGFWMKVLMDKTLNTH